MPRRRSLLLLSSLLTFACGRPLPPARLSAEAPPMRRELETKRRLAKQRCNGELGWLLPGVAQICHRKDAEAAVLTSLAVAEGSMAVAFASQVDDTEDPHPGIVLPLLGLQNLWMYSMADVGIERDRAAQKPYAPQDTLAELAFAPFNPCVLSQTDVWAGTLGFLALAFGASALAFDYEPSFARPRPFDFLGARVQPELGYPLTGATYGALFTHVAIGEETLFRGFLQSRFARHAGETGGWLAASSAFAAAHVPSAFAIDDQDDQEAYLLYGLPIVALGGAYLGMSYRWHDYSLAAPVAIHFWYDFLLSAATFVADPDDSLISATVRLPISL